MRTCDGMEALEIYDMTWLHPYSAMPYTIDYQLNLHSIHMHKDLS
jgi:hypothetical protein